MRRVRGGTRRAFLGLTGIGMVALGLRPALAGACAGLVAAALGTVIYTLHCPEMQAPFLAVWYLLGILAPAAAGALVGPRLLRW